MSDSSFISRRNALKRLLSGAALVLMLALGLQCARNAEVPVFRVSVVEDDASAVTETMTDDNEMQIHVRREIAIGSESVEKVFAVLSVDEGWEIMVKFTPDGAKKFDDLAEKAYKRRLAIIIDGKLMSAPIVMAKEFGGQIFISANLDKEETHRLAERIQASARKSE